MLLKKTSGFLYRAVVLFLLPLFLFSCESDPEMFGLDVTPPQDQIYAVMTDTAMIAAYSRIDDSMRTSLTSLNLLGSYMDPVFGRTTASFYTQCRLSKVNIDFGTDPYPDSLVLTLSYNGYYGDTNTRQTLRIYELSEAMDRDSAYYSNYSVSHYNRLLAYKTFLPRPSDSVLVGTQKIAPHLRVNLSDYSPDLANRLLQASAEDLADNGAFLEYFKGLYVEAEPVNYKGAILYFNLTTSLSKLTLYYHNEASDSLQFDFVINEESARFNHFEHYGFSNASQLLRKQVVYQDTALGQQDLFVQGMAGLRTLLFFPGLRHWADGDKIAINEAQLIIPCNEPVLEYDAPVKLLLQRTEKDGTLSILQDQKEGESYFGGSFNSSTKEYRFRLTRFVQDLLTSDSLQYGLALLPSGAAVRANRVVLGGPGNPVNNMRLRIVYSYKK